MKAIEVDLSSELRHQHTLPVLLNIAGRQPRVHRHVQLTECGWKAMQARSGLSGGLAHGLLRLLWEILWCVGRIWARLGSIFGNSFANLLADIRHRRSCLSPEDDQVRAAKDAYDRNKKENGLNNGIFKSRGSKRTDRRKSK